MGVIHVTLSMTAAQSEMFGEALRWAYARCEHVPARDLHPGRWVLMQGDEGFAFCEITDARDVKGSGGRRYAWLTLHDPARGADGTQDLVALRDDDSRPSLSAQDAAAVGLTPGGDRR